MPRTSMLLCFNLVVQTVAPGRIQEFSKGGAQIIKRYSLMSMGVTAKGPLASSPGRQLKFRNKDVFFPKL